MSQDDPNDSLGIVCPMSIVRTLDDWTNFYPFSPENPNGLNGLNGLKKSLLEEYKKKQSFRVAIGKSDWIDYEEFNPCYNLRQILNDEIVIEFDTKDENKAWEGINFTGINLLKAGVSFEVWDHGGKSPHLHIHNLPIGNLSPDKRAIFKKMFIRKYVPLEYLDCVDYSLTGTHLIAIEWSLHWKGCYGYKVLLSKFKPEGHL